jgi:serine/threonine-protein kinase HipA
MYDFTKNFAFKMNKNVEWNLSPAFDICHADRPGSLWVNQQSLSINGKRQNVTRDDFLSLAKQMNIKKISNIVPQVNEVGKNSGQYARKTHVNPILSDTINKTLITNTYPQ